MAHVRLSVESDVQDLEGCLRPADLKELKAHRVQAGPVLQVGLAASDPCLSIEHKGRCIAMFGATPVFEEPGMGNVWLLGSDEIKDISIQFLRESRKWLGRVAGGYDVLCNVVHEENELHHKWLKFLGFSFVRREAPWIEFARIF